MKTNYHTHTRRCQHAQGADQDYVLAALEGGFEALGFADHAPWPFGGGFVSPIRMGMEDLEDYLRAIRSLARSYAGRIAIHLGLEAEYFPRYHDHLLRLRDRGVRYFVLGQHYADSEEETLYTGLECRTDDGVRRYAEATVRAIRTGLFAYVAHPDLFMRHRSDDQFSPACQEAADMICQAAREQRMPLEYNLLGLRYQMEGHGRGYPSQPFWSYVQGKGNTIILGVDAHDPEHLRDTATWNTGLALAKATGMPLVDHLDLPD